MELIIYLIIGLLIGWLNYSLANQRGRDPMGWAIGGVIFGLFSTILLLVLGTTDKKRMDDAIATHKALNK
jgi:uncharacterized membrane protein YeaQ/YmgE (transglycosylase-associated protein family)